MALRTVLIVSPHFPPINAPDHQRVRMALPYFREFGWEPVVLAVAAEFSESSRDETLMATLPDDVEILTTYWGDPNLHQIESYISHGG